MTAFDFSAIRTTALGLIDQFGRDCKLLRNTDATALDPTKPWRVGAGTVVETPFRGPVTFAGFPKKSDPIVDQSECDVLVPGNLGIEPTTTDRLQVLGVINGQTDPIYAILGVSRTDPDGNSIMFKCRCAAWQNLTQRGSDGTV